MPDPLTIAAGAPVTSAVLSIRDLLSRLRLDYAFLGEVAHAAWLRRPAKEGAVDALVTVSAEGSRQIPMMGSHRGFLVDADALEVAEELDLIPMRHAESNLKVHLLKASNALYGTMVRAAVEAVIGGEVIRVLAAEDLALLLTVGGDEESLARRSELLLLLGAEFDYDRFNVRMRAIGLPGEILQP